MLKKVMIICLALSFVFIGGIGFVLAGDCDGTQKRDRDKLKDGPCLPFTNTDSSIIIAGYDDDKGKGDQNKSRDDSCDFTSSDSSIIIARHGNDKGRGDRDRLRDGSCLDS